MTFTVITVWGQGIAGGECFSVEIKKGDKALIHQDLSPQDKYFNTK